MPKKIQEVTTALKLIQKFSLVGAFTPKLDETIVPVVVTDDLRDVQEWKYAFIAETRGAGGVGIFNTWSLDSSAGSGRVLQLLSVRMFSGAVDEMYQGHVSPLTPELAGILTPAFQDMRATFDIPRRFPTGRPRFEALGALLAAIIVWRAPSDSAGAKEAQFDPEDCLIYPGERIFFQQTTANTACQWGVTWRERALRADGS